MTTTLILIQGESLDNTYIRRKPVELGDYTIMLPEKDYDCDFENGIFTVSRDKGAVVLEYPINAMIKKDTMLLHHPEQLLTYRNDSLMMVLHSISIDDTIVTDAIRFSDFQLFKKK